MRRVALALGVLLLAFVVALVVGVATTPSRQPVVAPATENIDAEAMTRHLAEAVRFRTVSAARAEDVQRDALNGLIAWMEQTYPRAHDQLVREVVGGYSLLYTWRGSDPSLPPILLMSHMDVVPVENEAEWTHPPFDGVIADGALWGRGTMDDKSGVVGILEAVEGLLAEGFTPRRTVYLSFGHDEETLGEGSLAAAALLRERGVRLSWVLDEGMVITDGIIKGVKAPAALIGVGERGYLSVRVEAADEGGHSSMPPPTTAAGRVARAVARIEADPFPAGLDGPATSLFEWLAPEMSQPLRTVFSNLWLFRPVVISQMTQKPSTNALARTTQAVTMLSGSLQDNVLPQRAWAVVNLRLHPRDTQASALARLAKVIDDPTITLSPYPSGLNGEPSPSSRDVGAPGFDTITAAIRALRPDVVVAPGLTVGATDARRFVDLADDVYRFMPLQLTEPERAAIHGTDERVKLDNLALFPAFYRQVIRRGAGS